MDYHIPVLLEECIQALNIKKNGNNEKIKKIYVDATFGGGGHTTAISQQLDNLGYIIAIDQDKESIARGLVRNNELGIDNITLVHNNFCNLKQILENLNIEKVHGILIDLGVSSHQLDSDYRGFSYTKDARLDMRMNTSEDLTAHKVVNYYEYERLKRIFKIYGEEPFASLIAKNIVITREKKEINTTKELFDLIVNSVPKKMGLSPVKRIFQAIRIEVNNELGIIEQTIKDSVDTLEVGGRLAIITFHSLEDRIVKQTYTSLANPCTCPRDFPHCICKKEPAVKIISRKPILPTNIEINKNSRSKSAKLRVIEKL